MAEKQLDRAPQTAGETGGGPPVPGAENSSVTAGEPPDNFAAAARGDDGRFAKGASGNPAARFRKGQSGNPKGRPKGASVFGSGKFRAGTRAAAALLDAQAEALAQKAVELALGGDPVAVRFCLGRILGARRGQPVALDLPAVAAPADLAAAVAAITGALGAGRLTPDEALACAQMLDGFPRVLAAGGAGAAAAPTEDPREELLAVLARMAAAGELDPAPDVPALLAEIGLGPARGGPDAAPSPPAPASARGLVDGDG